MAKRGLKPGLIAYSLFSGLFAIAFIVTAYKKKARFHGRAFGSCLFFFRLLLLFSPPDLFAFLQAL